MKDITEQLQAIKKRWEELPDNPDVRESFLFHLKSLSRFQNEPMDYLEVNEVEFPETINISYAVCHPECGIKEFIVDGSSQECQRCGGLSFREAIAEYRFIRKIR